MMLEVDVNALTGSFKAIESKNSKNPGFLQP